MTELPNIPTSGPPRGAAALGCAPSNSPDCDRAFKTDKFLRRRGIVLFLICLSVLVAAIAYHHHDVVQVSEEAVIRAGVGSDLLNGLSEGRQGLVGSLVWAPLPTLVGLPLVYVPRLGASSLAWPLIGAVVSAFTVVLLNRWLREAGLHWLIRYPVLLAYQLSPPVLAAVLAGSSALLLLAFLVALVHFLHHWLTTLDVRSLAYVGVLSGLAVVTDWRTILLVALVLIVVFLRLRGHVNLLPLRQKGFTRAALLIFLVPGLYLVAVWLLSNWLIMGNPVSFLKGLLGNTSLLPARWYSGFAWHLYLLAPLLLLLALLHARFVDTPRLALRLFSILLMAVLVLSPFLLQLTSRASYFDLYPQRVRTVDEIISFLEDRYPNSRVLVDGYYGYLFRARAHRQDLFVHSINLSLPEVDHRTHGKELFILLPRPEGLRSWEDIYLSHPGLFSDYEDYRVRDGEFSAAFVFEERWLLDDGRPQWLLLRVVLRRVGQSS